MRFIISHFYFLTHWARKLLIKSRLKNSFNKMNQFHESFFRKHLCEFMRGFLVLDLLKCSEFHSFLFVYFLSVCLFSFVYVLFFRFRLLQPDVDSMADEFLFPMTSRMSYTSTCPDSDGEFCEPETPVVSRQPSMILDSKTLDRYNSDPNLASQEKLNTSGIPDYNAPPPNR